MKEDNFTERRLEYRLPFNEKVIFESHNAQEPVAFCAMIDGTVPAVFKIKLYY